MREAQLALSALHALPAHGEAAGERPLSTCETELVSPRVGRFAGASFAHGGSGFPLAAAGARSPSCDF